MKYVLIVVAVLVAAIAVLAYVEHRAFRRQRQGDNFLRRRLGNRKP